MRDGVVFYKSFYESISELPPENALNIYNSIFRYAFFDEEPELSGIEKAIFTIIKPQIDANNRRYENGKRGGRPPKKTETTKEESKNHRFNKNETIGFEDKEPKDKVKDKDKAKEEIESIKDKVNENEKDIVCTEPDKPPHVPTVISLVLNDKTLYDISQSDIDGWKELYPAVDILQELRKMKGWCDSNPSKRKTRRGVKAFITNWLSREQDKGGTKTYGKSEQNTESESSAKLWSEKKEDTPHKEELIGDEWVDLDPVYK